MSRTRTFSSRTTLITWYASRIYLELLGIGAALTIVTGCSPQSLSLNSSANPTTSQSSSLNAQQLPNITGYYESAEGLTGVELKAALTKITSNAKTIAYDRLWKALADTDQDPKVPGNVILIYSGESVSKKYTVAFLNDSKKSKSADAWQNQAWNREHVWPYSRGIKGSAPAGKSDLHHIRPEFEKVNGLRGNKDFDEGDEENSYYPEIRSKSLSFEPMDSVKGDAARMMFYMAVRYSKAKLDLGNSVKGGGSVLGRLCILLKWHLQDPVDSREELRNSIIYENYQHNRNPFIDHPEWVEAIWGEQCL